MIIKGHIAYVEEKLGGTHAEPPHPSEQLLEPLATKAMMINRSLR